jgi:hypothetical protein
MRSPTLGNVGIDEKWEGTEDNPWNAGTHLSKSIKQQRTEEL